MARKPTGNPTGRPPFEPTDEQRRLVEQLASFGLKHEEIGAVIGISHVTLAKYFENELATASVKANAKVAHSLFKKCLEGDNTAMIFWLKTRAGWKETPQSVELTGKDGKPLAPPPTYAELMATMSAVNGNRHQATSETEED